MNIRTGKYTPLPNGNSPLQRPLAEYVKYVLLYVKYYSNLIFNYNLFILFKFVILIFSKKYFYF